MIPLKRGFGRPKKKRHGNLGLAKSRNLAAAVTNTHVGVLVEAARCAVPPGHPPRTYTELAAACNVSRVTFYRIMHGLARPRDTRMPTFARALNVTERTLRLALAADAAARKALEL